MFRPLILAHRNRGSALHAVGRLEEALAAYDRAIDLGANNAGLMNMVAWFRATAPDAKLLDAKRAVELSGRAVKLAPDEGTFWNTRGVALCRAGDWKAAAGALDESMRLRAGGDAHDWFFVAIARFHLGSREEARRWYDRAVASMQPDGPDGEELARFRREAAELLGAE